MLICMGRCLYTLAAVMVTGASYSLPGSYNGDLGCESQIFYSGLGYVNRHKIISGLSVLYHRSIL